MPSTKVVDTPNRARGPLSSAEVPAYNWREATTWSPEEHNANSTDEIAPIPEPKASASSAPSNSVIASSNARTVGFEYRA